MRGWKKVFYAYRNQKKAGVEILISDKIDFKIKTIIRDKEVHYIMIKGSIQEKDITIVNTYAPNIRASQHIRQMLTAKKGEINSDTIIVVDFNTQHINGQMIRQKISNETQALYNTLDQMDLIFI